MGDAMSAYTAGMVEAQGNNRNNDGMWGGGNWIWILVLFLLFSMFGNGWQNNGNTNRDCSCPSGVNVLPYLSLMSASANGAATRNDITNAFAVNNLQRGIDGLARGACDSTYALNNTMNSGFNAANIAMLQGFNCVDRQMCNIGFQLQDCCCQTQRAIDGVNYNMAANTCTLQNTMNNNTRDIIQAGHNDADRIYMKLCDMEAVRQAERLQAVERENQTLKFQQFMTTSQTAQNGYFDAVVNSAVAQLKPPSAVPSYNVPPPFPYCQPNGYNNGICGCNNGCNNGCNTCSC